jgi:hypothetical protein
MGENGTVWIITPPGMVQWNPDRVDYSYYLVAELLANYPIFVNSLEQGFGIMGKSSIVKN